MTAPEAQVRERILQAAARLAGEGLIERTWGNISARVSETRFLITPSGLAYETLRPEQLVPVNIADASWEGDIKPSSEKGIHADAYRLRPEVNFIIHTHQYFASVAGIEGRALTGFIHPLLGKRVPCAAYGLPGTKKLRRAVEAEEAAWPDCRAFLLRNHGALCLGRDLQDAFAAARALEEVCGARVRDRLGDLPAGEAPTVPEELLTAVPEGLCALWDASPEVLAVSAQGRRLRPYLDDLAQIAGVDVLCAPPDPGRVRKALRGRNAVLIRGAGAICTGDTESGAEAVRALLRKGCAAKLYAEAVGGCRPLAPADAALQRLVYQRSYKRKGQCR